MRKQTEKAVINRQEVEMFEMEDNKPALPLKVGLVGYIRSKICQMFRVQR